MSALLPALMTNALAAAFTFVWLGMVLAISFLEAPLKFRAPGITLPLGLGIGRIVFRALNVAEVVLAVGIALAFLRQPTYWVAYAIPTAMLAIQLIAIRPRLTKRTNEVLAGKEGPRSHAHLAYVATEVVKVGGLIYLGAACLGAWATAG